MLIAASPAGLIWEMWAQTFPSVRVGCMLIYPEKLGEARR